MFLSGLLLTLLALLLGACSPGHVAAGKNGVGVWQFVGCHAIEQAPPRQGVHVIHPFGDMQSGRFYFKQATNLDGRIGPVVNGRPCQ
jgi:hypothetical protein